MDANQIKIQLATAKANVKKGDIAGSLKRFIYALHALSQSNNIPTEIRSLIRDTVVEYNSFSSLKEELNISGFNYVPGEEKKLLVTCMKAYEFLTKDDTPKETYEEALKRKKNLDTHLIAAKDFLSRGFLEAADEEVEKALEFYRDENTVFSYLGQLYLEKGYVGRAKSFYKRATEAEPDNQSVMEKYLEVSKMPQR